MAYTDFKSIPAEMVVNDEATWAVIHNTIKCPENMKICEACMNVIKQKYMNDPNPYKAQAYRRAAILVANVDFPLISQKGLATMLYDCKSLGLSWGNTSVYIFSYIRNCLLVDKLQKNIYEAFPPSWRGNLLKGDIRINMALQTLDFFINKIDLWPEYRHSVGEKQEAFKFYDTFTKNEQEILVNHIKNFVLEACC